MITRLLRTLALCAMLIVCDDGGVELMNVQHRVVAARTHCHRS